MNWARGYLTALVRGAKMGLPRLQPIHDETLSVTQNQQYPAQRETNERYGERGEKLCTPLLEQPEIAGTLLPKDF